MGKGIKPGVKCVVTGRHEAKGHGNRTSTPIIGEGPNLGIVVTVIKYIDELEGLGNVWLVDAGHPCLVEYYGNVLQQAAFSEAILEPIPEANIVTLKQIVATA